MDQNFTKELQEYLAIPEDKRDIPTGAMLLLKLNRNRILYNTIIRRPQQQKERLFYLLEKFLKQRLSTVTAEQIRQLETEVKQVEKTTLVKLDQLTGKDGEVALGKREDHDQLPASIQELWVQNGELARQIRSKHELLKLMSDKPACERYEELKVLVESDRKLKANWEQYDTYVIVTKEGNTGNPDADKLVVTLTAQEITSARKYLSSNKSKLATLKAGEDQVKYLQLLEKMQERYDQLIRGGQTFDSKQVVELEELGLTVEY